MSALEQPERMAHGALHISTFCAGPFETNGYLLIDVGSGNCLIVDVPIASAALFSAEIESRALRPLSIVLTHGHFDHVGDAAELAERLGIPVLLHAEDAALAAAPMVRFPGLGLEVRGVRPGGLLADGDTVECASLRFEALHCPGHTPGHLCLLERAHGILLTGDVLFRGSVGRTDLPGGDYETLMHSISSRLLPLPDETVVHPGHGPATTVGEERAGNPFLREWMDHF